MVVRWNVCAEVIRWNVFAQLLGGMFVLKMSDGLFVLKCSDGILTSGGYMCVCMSGDSCAGAAWSTGPSQTSHEHGPGPGQRGCRQQVREKT